MVCIVNLRTPINLPRHPTVPWFIPISALPTKNLTDRIYGVSMLQIFEPFSLFCNAYTGKWSKWRHCVTQQYYTVESRNLILLSLKLQWPSTGCSFSDEVEINIYIGRINPVLCWVLFFLFKGVSLRLNTKPIIWYICTSWKSENTVQ